MRAAAEAFAEEGVEAVAISFMHSPTNPEHERRAHDLLQGSARRVHLRVERRCCSQLRFYDRTSTTVLNAYVGPIISRYLDALAGRLDEAGFAGELLIMQSNGGVTSAEAARARGADAAVRAGRRPGRGPVPAGAARLRECITIDMGGTSFDAALVKDGAPLMMLDGLVDRWRLALPMIDIHTIGAGGGSIAWLDEGGLLQRRARQRGRRAGARLLRPRRPRADGDRRRSRPRLSGRGVVRPRRDEARPRGRGDRPGAHRRSSRPERREAAAGVYDVVNVEMAAGVRDVSVRGAWTRAPSRSSSRAGRARCTRRRSPASSRSRRSSCRGSRRSSARPAC